jgi:hypothetical protein
MHQRFSQRQLQHVLGGLGERDVPATTSSMPIDRSALASSWLIHPHRSPRS